MKLRNDFYKNDVLAARVTTTGGWLDIAQRKLVSPPEVCCRHCAMPPAAGTSRISPIVRAAPGLFASLSATWLAGRCTAVNSRTRPLVLYIEVCGVLALALALAYAPQNVFAWTYFGWE